MFGAVAAFEFRYQTRQPVFWVVGILFLLLSFGVVASDQLSIGGVGNVKENSPFALGMSTMVWSLFFMFVTTAFVANVVVRDAETGYGPIIRATRVRKFDYLIGRFTGAMAAAGLCYLTVPLGTFLGTLMPWVDPETLGPNVLWNYVQPLLTLALPNLLLTGALFFAVATVTRSMMWTYVGVVGFLIAYLTLGSLGSRPELEDTVALLEPFGGSAFGLATEYWTATERNTRLVGLEGLLLWNRLLVLGVALASLVAGFVLFRFETRGAKLRKAEKLKAVAAAAAGAPTVTGPLPAPRFNGTTARVQLIARTRFEMGQVFKSPAFFVLLALGLFNSVASLLFAGSLYGAETWLVTRLVVQTLQSAFTFVPLIVAIYYAGELVWRERERRTHEIVDATAVPDWAFVLPKTLAISLVLLALLLTSVVAGIATQAFRGVTDFELDNYLLWYVLPETISAVHLAVLAVFIQALVPHKFIGWGVMLIYLISRVVASNLGFDHPLYNYGAGIDVPLSDMNGMGRFWIGRTWLDAYWSAFAVILVIVAYALWRRGTETRLLPRLRRAPARLKGPAGLTAGVAAAAFVAMGAFIFVNTNVWNEYRNGRDAERWSADYEKALLAYETVPQPNITEVKLVLDLDPHAPRLETRGQYVLENRTDTPMTEVHMRFDRGVRVIDVALDGSSPGRTYDRFNYQILTLDRPLAPGERRTLSFVTEVAQRGFRASGNLTQIVDNGTFIDNFTFAPSLGMNRGGLLQDRAVRRRNGLPEEVRMARLEDTSAQSRNYVNNVDWVRSDITVTTVAGQTPVAPGYKVSDVTRGNRRTARFVSEAPILHFFSVQSADYEIARRMHRGVELAVYYDRRHAWNVERMLTALATGLDYYQANFSPYQFRQARILEFPAYAGFAQAFANTMPYSESIGFISRLDESGERIDYVTFVTAHELAHQWWAHQVVGADMQGSLVLSETLAQYGALMVMEQIYGPDQIRRFLKFELDRYLGARGSEVLEELPLYRVEGQGYIAYQKGGQVMYLLRDQIGEAAVNAALRRVIADHAFKSAPFPRSLDLIAALRAEAPADKQALITDLFERITLYDVKVADVAVTDRPDGRFDVAVTVEARKLYADGQGVETEAQLNETFDLGLFTAEPGRAAFDAEDVLVLERRPIRSGTQTLRFTTATRPTHVGVDPYNKWIDRNSDDNVRAVAGTGPLGRAG